MPSPSVTSVCPRHPRAALVTRSQAEVAALLMKAKADNAKAVEEAEEALAMKELSVADAKERKER